MLNLRPAYPIVFAGYRGFSPGITGLAFTGLAVGCFLVIGLEPVIRRMIDSHRKDPDTGKVTPEAMVSVICIAAVMAPVGEIWFAWTCIPPVHWIWPILAGIPVRLFLIVTAPHCSYQIQIKLHFLFHPKIPHMCHFSPSSCEHTC